MNSPAHELRVKVVQLAQFSLANAGTLETT